MIIVVLEEGTADLVFLLCLCLARASMRYFGESKHGVLDERKYGVLASSLGS